jgi:hypothetical protein
LPEEYKGLSLKISNQSNETSSSEDRDLLTANSSTLKKNSVDSDFRAKYKTEICKFWGVNKECRYGNNVKIVYNFSALSLMEMMT